MRLCKYGSMEDRVSRLIMFALAIVDGVVGLLTLGVVDMGLEVGYVMRRMGKLAKEKTDAS